jgi:hypothetical protein
MAHNVPAVDDVLAARISKCGAFAGRTKCGGEKPHKGHRPTAVFRSPSRLLAAKRKQTCYAKCPRTPLFYVSIIFCFNFSYVNFAIIIDIIAPMNTNNSTKNIFFMTPTCIAAAGISIIACNIMEKGYSHNLFFP